jgi:hypothetical protein
MSRCLRLARVFFSCSTLALASVAVADPPRETGVRGRVVVAPEILAAKEWPVDATRAEALRTAANIRRPLGRRIAAMTEDVPAVSVVLEGEDLRNDAVAPTKVTITGMRFRPGQVLLPRPGPVTFENQQGISLTLVDASGKVLQVVEAGASAEVSLPAGLHAITMKELPYARASVRVLTRGKILPIGTDGLIDRVDVPGGDYRLAFYLGAAELRSQDMSMPTNGLLFIDATVSANTVVDVSVKDATLQVAIPVSP